MTFPAMRKKLIDEGYSRVTSCEKGYAMGSSGGCEDVNECENNPCFGECINTMGSFECRCPDGFKMVDGVCHGKISQFY